MNFKLIALFICVTPLAYSQSFEFSPEQVKDYHSKASDNEALVQGLIANAFFEGSRDVLDVGCGEGKLTSSFASKLPDIQFVGSDVSKEMIHYASSHYKSPNLKFVEKNAEELGFDAQFDAAISFNALHWMKDQKKALEQIFKALKPGGKAILVATPRLGKNDFEKACRNVIITFRWLFYFITFKSVHSFHSEHEYRTILKEVGFQIESITIRPTQMDFANRRELDAFLGAVLTPLHHLNERYRPAFLDDFYSALKDMGNVDADGKIRIVFDQIEMRLTKPEACKLKSLELAPS